MNDYINKNKVINLLKIIDSEEQARVIAYILENTNEHYQFLGSYKEIQENVKCGSSTVMYAFRKLKDNNYIEPIKKGIWEVNLLK